MGSEKWLDWQYKIVRPCGQKVYEARCRSSAARVIAKRLFSAVFFCSNNAANRSSSFYPVIARRDSLAILLFLLFSYRPILSAHSFLAQRPDYTAIGGLDIGPRSRTTAEQITPCSESCDANKKPQSGVFTEAEISRSSANYVDSISERM